MLLMSATPAGMAGNQPRSKALGRTDDANDAVAALARKVLSLTPPAAATPAAAASALGGSLAGRLRGIGQ